MEVNIRRAMQHARGLMMIEYKAIKAYTANLILFILSFPVYIAAVYFLWSSIYASGGMPEISFFGIFTYYVVMWFLMWVADGEYITYVVSRQIVRGKAAAELTKPVSFYLFYFWQRMMSALFLSIMTLPFVIGVLCIFPLEISRNPITIALFVAFVIVSTALSFSINFLVAITSFKLGRIRGIGRIARMIRHFFAGALVPLYLFPSILEEVADILPFKYLIFIPIQVITGNIPNNEAFILLIYAILWTVIVYLIGFFAFKKLIRYFTAPGL